MNFPPAEPVKSLLLLPLDGGEEAERQWLQDALDWLTDAPEDRTARLRHLAEGLRSEPGMQARFREIWVRAFAPRVYAEAGMPEATSLPRELIGRLKLRLLPQLTNELDLYAALHVAQLTDADAEWIGGLTESEIAPWRDLLGGPSQDLAIALRLLATKAAAIGLSRGIMKVMPHRCETESPFFALEDTSGGVARSPDSTEAQEALQEIILQCRMSAGVAHARLEEEGVSSDLVFRLDLLISQLERMDLLLRVASGREDGRAFAAMLVRSFAVERGLHVLLRNSVNRVARQIVTHTGRSGGHYIAGSHAEWRSMGLGALGAGAITAFTALFKYLFVSMRMAPLWVGVAHSLNYTASFVLMQALGWPLASKMPSMTAAALCDAMEKEDGMHAEVRLVAAITRTQCIVTLGNLLGAIPMSLAIDLFIQWRNGNPFLDHEAAMHGVAAMNLLRSWTVPFAALTGCFLWLSSLVAGWTANWMVLNRLPAGVAQSRRIRRSLGAQGAIEFARILEHHLSGVAGYVCLGLLLGLLPFIGVFAGVPLEVRHITLASASMAYDVSSLAWHGPVPWTAVSFATLGLVATGLMNFSVSFALGLWLAMRARNLSPVGRRMLARELWQELRRNPTCFLWRDCGVGGHTK